MKGRGRTQQESISGGPRNFRKYVKDPSRESDETGQTQIRSLSKHCAPAEWKDKVYIKSSLLPDPSRLADEHNCAFKTQIITQMKRHTLLTSSACKVNMGHRESYMFNALCIEGMDNSVQGQTIIPGCTEQCM